MIRLQRSRTSRTGTLSAFEISAARATRVARTTRLSLAGALLVATLAHAAGTNAADTTTPALTWTTLGTAAGPVLYAERSQPANLLRVDGKPWLVDCGDGALERLAAAGYRASQVDTVWISHLHMDHIGGLQALLGLRWMQSASSVLTIYGPPGTDAVVAGLVQSLKPVSMIEGGKTNKMSPDQLVKVVIVTDGDDRTVGGVRVRAVRNSHFDDEPGHPADNGTESLSYRFDYRGRAIGYTGDTGPSDAVARLEQGVDVLVSEVIDLGPIVANIDRAMSSMPPKAKDALIRHLQAQHLTPQGAGTMASEAGAHRLVFTHLGIVGPTDATAPKLMSEARTTYTGPISVAHDLDTF